MPVFHNLCWIFVVEWVETYISAHKVRGLIPKDRQWDISNWQRQVSGTSRLQLPVTSIIGLSKNRLRVSNMLSVKFEKKRMLYLCFYAGQKKSKTPCTQSIYKTYKTKKLYFSKIALKIFITTFFCVVSLSQWGLWLQYLSFLVLNIYIYILQIPIYSLRRTLTRK